MADKKETVFKECFDKDNKTLIAAALEGSPNWGNRVDALSKASWDEVKTFISSDRYTPLRNEVLTNLINRIGETILQVQDFSNPLRHFKVGQMAYGDTVQEIATDVIAQEEFIGGADCKKGQEPNQFERAPNDVVAAYHRINREAQYPITIDDPRQRRAFLNPRGLFELLDEKVSMLEKSNIIDEFVYGKKLISEFFASGNLQETQKLKVGDLTPNSTAEQVRLWLIKVKTALRRLTFPNRGTTIANIMTQSAPSDLVIILRYDLPIINEVSNLSQAFHAEFMDLNIPIISIDSFADDGGESDIIGCVADRRAFQIRENYRSITTADNAKGLYRNYFLNIWQLYMASPLKPVIYLTK